jgi:hypothetical protein
VTPSDVCNAIKFCDAVAHTLPWGVIGAVRAAVALTYGSPCRLHWSCTCTGSEANE